MNIHFLYINIKQQYHGHQVNDFNILNKESITVVICNIYKMFHISGESSSHIAVSATFQRCVPVTTVLTSGTYQTISWSRGLFSFPEHSG